MGPNIKIATYLCRGHRSNIEVESFSPIFFTGRVGSDKCLFIALEATLGLVIEHYCSIHILTVRSR
jgi:hypothetical protein